MVNQFKPVPSRRPDGPSPGSSCRYRRILAAAFIATAAAAPADPPAGYYDAVDDNNAAVLRTTLHEVIDDHTRFPYTSGTTDTWDILEDAQEDPGNASNILDIYGNRSLAKFGGGVGPYNREHTWPKSYGFPNDNAGNYPYTDCHQLFLCDADLNSERENKPYRSCNAVCMERTTEVNNGQGGGSGVYPGNSNWLVGSFISGTWETWIGRRGDVARALFYMDVRYEGGTHGATGYAEPDLALTDSQSLIAAGQTGSNESQAYMGELSVLVQWHQQDPVDAFEQRRNDVVFSYQGNRNPFVDHPEWADCLFAGDCDPGGEPVVPTWINEIHYDNTAGDVDEGVEIAGPAGVDLTGWSLVAYNGATLDAYDSLLLSGVLPGQQNGNGTLWFPLLGLQNGSPDGVALIDPMGAVVEFISYEGSFTADDGPAAGMASVDIGVSEPNDTPIGHSLQLQGTGNQRSDFIWASPSTHTRGAVNNGQTFLAGGPGIPAISNRGLIVVSALVLMLGVVVVRRRCPR